MSKTSLSSSRRSSKMRDDSELYLECKAAFLTEFDDIEEKIESKNKLVSLLQLTGRNPTRLALNKYWSTGTRTLSFSDFVEICNKEPITKEDDLMKAFRKIDINGDGYISLDELYKIMNQKGESMSRDEVRKMIDEVDENKDGRLDYKEFTQMVLQTAEKSKQMSKKVMERKERKKKKGELSAKNSNNDNNPDKNKQTETFELEETLLNKSDNETENALQNKLDDTMHGTMGSHTSLRDEIRASKGDLQGSFRESRTGSSLSLQKQESETVRGSKTSLHTGEDREDESLNVVTDQNTDYMRSSKTSLKSAARDSKMGSKASLRSESKANLKDDVNSSRTTLKEAKDDISASKVSIRSEVRESKLGSNTSLRSETKAKLDDINASSTTLKEVMDDVASSKASIKAAIRDSDLGSKASLRERNTAKGSLASLRSIKKETSDTGNEAPKRRESTSSQHSQVSKQDDIVPQSPKQGQTKHDKTTLGSPTESIKAAMSSKSEPKSNLYPNLNVDADKAAANKNINEKITSEKSPKSSSVVLQDQVSKGSPRKDAQTSAKSSPKHVEFEPIRTPRGKFGIPTITQLERPGTSYRKELDENHATKSTNDSARSVQEEIPLEDDDDIVSTGRSTPRVHLSSRKDTPKSESARSVKHDPDQDGQKKEEKGNKFDKSTANEASLSTMHDSHKNISGDGKESDKHKKDDKRSSAEESKKEKAEQKGEASTKATRDSDKSTTNEKKNIDDVSETKEATDSDAVKADKKESTSDVREKDGGDLSMMAIYTGNQGHKDPIVTRQEILDGVAKSDVSVSQIEKKPPSGKDTTNQHSGSKKDGDKQAETESRMSKSAKINDNELGSQSSLRSGDKESGVPVPSPRKSVNQSGIKEDDLPRPSPRVRTSKTKSPSSSLRSKDKLPDARSLQDWYHYTSKGCFFYEDEEIVGHVYNLRLQDDSLVYLSAEPISEPPCLNLPGSEPIDTALYVFDSSGRLVTTTEQRDVQGTYGVKVELSAGEYQILPYTTGCRFKQRQDMSASQNEAKLVKKNKDDKIHITSVFREALKNIFNLCDLDGNGTMSKDEFNWFNVRTSGEELGDEEWEVVEEKTTLRDGEITLEGFIELNELEAEDAEGDVEDLWITLTSMGMNKALIMDEACPYRVNVYVKDVGRKKPSLRVTGIESLEKREFVTEICQSVIEKSPGPISIRKMKDLFLYTYKNDYRATMVIENKSRSTVMLQIDCSKSRNVISNRSGLDHTFEIDPQQTAIAHHLMPKSELSDWTVESTQSIQK